MVLQNIGGIDAGDIGIEKAQGIAWSGSRMRSFGEHDYTTKPASKTSSIDNMRGARVEGNNIGAPV